MSSATARARMAFDGLDVLIERWGEMVVKDRKRRIRQANLSMSGNLERSVRAEQKKLGDATFEVRIKYRYYGRFFDSKSPTKMRGGGRGYVTRLMGWIDYRGLESFTVRRANASYEKQVRDLAWAIIKSNEGRRPWRPTKWLSPVEPDMKSLEDSVLRHLGEELIQDQITVLTV